MKMPKRCSKPNLGPQELVHSLGKCWKTGKLQYIDQPTARKMVRLVKQLKAEYLCYFCGRWHTTSQRRKIIR